MICLSTLGWRWNLMLWLPTKLTVYQNWSMPILHWSNKIHEPGIPQWPSDTDHRPNSVTAKKFVLQHKTRSCSRPTYCHAPLIISSAYIIRICSQFRTKISKLPDSDFLAPMLSTSFISSFFSLFSYSIVNASRGCRRSAITRARPRECSAWMKSEPHCLPLPHSVNSQLLVGVNCY